MLVLRLSFSSRTPFPSVFGHLLLLRFRPSVSSPLLSSLLLLRFFRGLLFLRKFRRSFRGFFLSSLQRRTFLLLLAQAHRSQSFRFSFCSLLARVLGLLDAALDIVPEVSFAKLKLPLQFFLFFPTHKPHSA